MLESYKKHEDFIKSFWQTRTPEVDDLSAMYLGLAEEIGEFQEEYALESQHNPHHKDELKSELSDILFYITGILIELSKREYNLTASSIMLKDISIPITDTTDTYVSCLYKRVFKLLSMYNKSIRKRVKMDEELLSQNIRDIYACVEGITDLALADVLDYNVEKLSGRDISGQNGTVA